MSAVADLNLPDAQGHLGQYGGRYEPETLMHPLQELEAEYFRAQHDPEFQKELSYYLTEFVGRPTPLYYAERLGKEDRWPTLREGCVGGLAVPDPRRRLISGPRAGASTPQGSAQKCAP